MAQAKAEKESFAKHPLAPIEDEAEERERLKLLREDDPIAIQDIFNTSAALVEAVKNHDIKEVRQIVQDAERGEFLQGHVFQAFMLALREPDLEMVKLFVAWGVPLDYPQYAESQQFLAEVVNRKNFSDATRIMELLHKGNDTMGARLDIDTPRTKDSFTALCIGCDQACLPLVFKLLEMGASPNTITRNDETPMSLALRARASDSEEQKEARPIIANMLREAGGKQDSKSALQALFGRPGNRNAGVAGA